MDRGTGCTFPCYAVALSHLRNSKVYGDIYHELEEIALEDKSLRDVFQHCEELSMEQEQRQVYDGQVKQIMDKEAAQREAELRIQKAEEKVEKKIKEEKEAIACCLLEKGMDIEFVADSTELEKQKSFDIQQDVQ